MKKGLEKATIIFFRCFLELIEVWRNFGVEKDYESLFNPRFCHFLHRLFFFFLRS